jgi:hypothetical protein
MLIEHHPSHLNYSVVFSFHDSILLRNTQSRKLLINTMLKTKLIKRGIPKPGAKNECDHKKIMRLSQGKNMRRTKRSITRTRSWTNKKSSKACP